MADDREIRQRIAKIENLIQVLEEQADPAVCAQARELVQAILEHHGVGLARIMELANQLGTPQLLESLVSDDLVGSLLLLHGLHPVDTPTRVKQALERMKPRLFVHGSRVELLAVENNAVRLRLLVADNGSPAVAAPQQLKRWVEEAICGAAPEITMFDFEESAPSPSGLVSLPILTGADMRGRP